MSETNNRIDNDRIVPGSRVRYRGQHTGPVGRVIETTHCAAIVLWAPILINVGTARFLDARRGSSSLSDLELCE